MTDKRYKVGIGVTVAYLVVLSAYVIVQRGPVFDMKPNEFGDFLAGAASPLAFLWLVLGYLQQGEELKQNTEALNLQIREFKASVEQQQALVEATLLQHEFEISRDRVQRRTLFLAKQPNFLLEVEYESLRENEVEWTLILTNIGFRCTNVDVNVDEGVADGPLLSVLDQEESESWRALTPRSTGPFIVLISYVDGNGEPQRQEIQASALFTDSGELVDVFCGERKQIFPWENSEGLGEVTS